MQATVQRMRDLLHASENAGDPLPVAEQKALIRRVQQLTARANAIKQRRLAGDKEDTSGWNRGRRIVHEPESSDTESEDRTPQADAQVSEDRTSLAEAQVSEDQAPMAVVQVSEDWAPMVSASAAASAAAAAADVTLMPQVRNSEDTDAAPVEDLESAAQSSQPVGLGCRACPPTQPTSSSKVQIPHVILPPDTAGGGVGIISPQECIEWDDQQLWACQPDKAGNVDVFSQCLAGMAYPQHHITRMAGKPVTIVDTYINQVLTSRPLVRGDGGDAMGSSILDIINSKAGQHAARRPVSELAGTRPSIDFNAADGSVHEYKHAFVGFHLKRGAETKSVANKYMKLALSGRHDIHWHGTARARPQPRPTPCAP